MMKNKRGDIPITILVIGILSICAIAILSFSISDKSSKNDFSGLGIVEKAAVMREKISFYSELGFDEKEIEEFSEMSYYIKEDEVRKTKYIFLENEQISVRYDLSKQE